MKKHFSFLVLLITFVCLPATAFMASLNYEGEPDMLNPNHILGAFAWHNNDGFHLRTTAIGEKHVFTGIIHTNGYFKDIDDRLFRDGDYYHLKDRDTIEFQFTTDNRSVGINFNVTNGDYTAFELYMDGHKISPMDVYVGKDGWHPGDYKFTLDRPAYPSYYNDERSVVIVHDGWYGFGWHHHHHHGW